MDRGQPRARGRDPAGRSREAQSVASDDPALDDALDRIVVAYVHGFELMWNDHGDTSLVPVPDAAQDVQAAVEEGFVAGVSRAFINPKLDPEAQNWDRPGRLAIHSAVAAYEDEESAQAALEAVIDETGTIRYLEPAGEVRLGDGGSVFEGALPYMSGIPRHFQAWRTGSLALFLFVDGSIEQDAGRIRAIAAGMQERAAEELGG